LEAGDDDGEEEGKEDGDEDGEEESKEDEGVALSCWEARTSLSALAPAAAAIMPKIAQLEWCAEQHTIGLHGYKRLGHCRDDARRQTEQY